MYLRLHVLQRTRDKTLPPASVHVLVSTRLNDSTAQSIVIDPAASDVPTVMLKSIHLYPTLSTVDIKRVPPGPLNPPNADNSSFKIVQTLQQVTFGRLQGGTRFVSVVASVGRVLDSGGLPSSSNNSLVSKSRSPSDMKPQLDVVAGGKLISFFDVQGAFHQIPIAEEEETAVFAAENNVNGF